MKKLIIKLTIVALVSIGKVQAMELQTFQCKSTEDNEFIIYTDEQKKNLFCKDKKKSTNNIEKLLSVEVNEESFLEEIPLIGRVATFFNNIFNMDDLKPSIEMFKVSPGCRFLVALETLDKEDDNQYKDQKRFHCINLKTKQRESIPIPEGKIKIETTDTQEVIDLLNKGYFVAGKHSEGMRLIAGPGLAGHNHQLFKVGSNITTYYMAQFIDNIAISNDEKFAYSNSTGIYLIDPNDNTNNNQSIKPLKNFKLKQFSSIPSGGLGQAFQAVEKLEFNPEGKLSIKYTQEGQKQTNCEVEYIPLQ